MLLLSVVGARPQFIKAAAICRAIDRHSGSEPIKHEIVHTGQHYDPEMSEIFFRELSIPAPGYHLDVGSGSHAGQTAEIMKRLEPVLQTEKPDWVLLYGDTNSTLAGAVVAAKLGLRSAHVEAGLRSYNRRMPEEINRIVADHLSELLLCPTAAALDNLRQEGLAARAVMTGDVMYDAALTYRQAAERQSGVLAQTWHPGAFALATVHRAENTDDPSRLLAILSALEDMAERLCPVLLPLHPRTKKSAAQIAWMPRAVTVIPPVSYLEMVLLESRARLILTDSGGVQKEAYFLKVPCITLRNETEWVETLTNDCNVLVGADPQKIMAAARNAGKAGPWTAVYGDGSAGTAILRALAAQNNPNG